MTRTRFSRSAEPRPGGHGSGAPTRAGNTPPPASPRSSTTSDGASQFIGRQRILWVLIMVACLAISGRMVYVHAIAADEISAQAAQQRSITEVLPAIRGSIVDRNGRLLAHSDDARALTFQPKAVRKQITEEHEKDPSVPDAEVRLGQIADGVSSALGGSISSETCWHSSNPTRTSCTSLDWCRSRPRRRSKTSSRGRRRTAEQPAVPGRIARGEHRR